MQQHPGTKMYLEEKQNYQKQYLQMKNISQNWDVVHQAERMWQPYMIKEQFGMDWSYSFHKKSDGWEPRAP